jgi:hypothetical protein
LAGNVQKTAAHTIAGKGVQVTNVHLVAKGLGVANLVRAIGVLQIATVGLIATFGATTANT